MNEQVSFTLRGRNPDVLTCIANLFNDEVTTQVLLIRRVGTAHAGFMNRAKSGTAWATGSSARNRQMGATAVTMLRIETMGLPELTPMPRRAA